MRVMLSLFAAGPSAAAALIPFGMGTLGGAPAAQEEREEQEVQRQHQAASTAAVASAAAAEKKRLAVVEQEQLARTRYNLAQARRAKKQRARQEAKQRKADKAAAKAAAKPRNKRVKTPTASIAPATPAAPDAAARAQPQSRASQRHRGAAAATAASPYAHSETRDGPVHLDRDTPWSMQNCASNDRLTTQERKAMFELIEPLRASLPEFATKLSEACATRREGRVQDVVRKWCARAGTVNVPVIDTSGTLDGSLQPTFKLRFQQDVQLTFSPLPSARCGDGVVVWFMFVSDHTRNAANTKQYRTVPRTIRRALRDESARARPCTRAGGGALRPLS